MDSCPPETPAFPQHPPYPLRLGNDTRGQKETWMSSHMSLVVYLIHPEVAYEYNSHNLRLAKLTPTPLP